MTLFRRLSSAKISAIYASKFVMRNSIFLHASNFNRKSGHFAGTRCFSSDSTKCLKLEGSCSCGSCKWTAIGSSSLNFICHCSLCRDASKSKMLPAVGFLPEQVNWSSKEFLSWKTPKGSKNKRAFCSKCGDYVAEDASVSLGLIAFPLQKSNVDKRKEYLPSHHIFYKDRVEDVEDNLPKWESLVQSVCIKSPDKSFHLSRNLPPKSVLPLSNIKVPEPREYVFTHTDPTPSHRTEISAEKIRSRVQNKYIFPDSKAYVAPKKTERDVIIIGGGHNGLVTAAYLAKYGIDALVLERRHCVGGAAVTEELYPGFKFSRASYLAGLLRPQLIKELELENFGFVYLPRNPSSFTPTKKAGEYLLLGSDEEKNHQSIAQFSKRDADIFPLYEQFLHKIRKIVNPLLDGAPPSLFGQQSFREKIFTLKHSKKIMETLIENRDSVIPLYELLTAPASQILDRWFESDILKTTLATDAVIGALVSPSQSSSAYVLLHHVMGESAGIEGVWSYIKGGMGSVSNSIASSARRHGAEIITNAPVRQILFEDNRCTGVMMEDGSIISAKVVISNATPYHTFLELLPGFSSEDTSPIPREFSERIQFADYKCGAFKINCAIDELPDFICNPNEGKLVSPHHIATTHFESRMEEIENAFREASMGIPASRPVIELTIPSSLDDSIAPPGKHVAQLFVQFAPYDLDPKCGNWADESFKNAFADRVFSIVDEFAPNFSKSVLFRDVLSPLDLERVFGLHKGNIFHSSLAIHQLAYCRPDPGYSNYRSPLSKLYLCGSGTHPGGGVMGAAGRNCARTVLFDLGIKAPLDGSL